jgi:hypothetical protein
MHVRYGGGFVWSSSIESTLITDKHPMVFLIAGGQQPLDQEHPMAEIATAIYV